MKLDWKRAGLASIAEHNGYGFEVWSRGTSSIWIVTHEGTTIGQAQHERDNTESERQCEKWIEQHDRPEWHDATDWLSWAEWRGWKMIVSDSIGSIVGRVSDAGKGYVTYPYGTTAEAKAAAEKWVREQGAR